MTDPRIPQSLREFVRQRAGQRCEYCQTSEQISGLEHEIDHIIPRASQGTTTAENLCLACSSCNGYKQAKTHETDPESGNVVPLFHPRQQRWREHFVWSADGTQIIGLTPSGRATIQALNLNHPLIVSARRRWTAAGWHPPKE